MAGESRRRPCLTGLQGIAPRATSARAAAPAALADCDFDTALVVYRHVNVEGFIAYRLKLLLDAVVVHRPGAARAHPGDEVIIYSIAWKRLPDIPSCPAPRPACATDQESSSRRRFGPTHTALATALRRVRADRGAVPRRPVGQANPGQAASPATPGPVAHYQRADVLKAFERAVRFGAFSLAAMRRILAATAKPKPILDKLPSCTTTLPPRCARTRSARADQRLSTVTLTRGNR